MTSPEEMPMRAWFVTFLVMAVVALAVVNVFAAAKKLREEERRERLRRARESNVE